MTEDMNVFLRRLISCAGIQRSYHLGGGGGSGGVTATCSAKLCCGNCLWRKQGYVNAGAYGPTLSPLPEIYFSTLNIHTVFVQPMLPACASVELVTDHVCPYVFKFYSFWKFFSPVCI